MTEQTQQAALPLNRFGFRSVIDLTVHLLFAILILAAAVALTRDTLWNGHDFEVFWRTGHLLRQSESIYDVARLGGMVFKYPPWISPLFVPWSYLPLEWA